MTQTLPPAAEPALAEDEGPTQRLPAGEKAEGDEAADDLAEEPTVRMGRRRGGPG